MTSSRVATSCRLPALAAALLGLCSGLAAADAPPQAQAVLAQEGRWLGAIAARDAHTLGIILAANFVHITYRGALRYREDELADVLRPKAYTQRTTEQTVDFAGDAAVVHGLNTLTQDGKVVLRLRYTDVYRKAGGKWQALSAQETSVTGNP